MQVFTLNKNVVHDGKAYAKGSTIEKSNDHFQVLYGAGHVDAVGEAEPSEPIVPNDNGGDAGKNIDQGGADESAGQDEAKDEAASDSQSVEPAQSRRRRG